MVCVMWRLLQNDGLCKVNTLHKKVVHGSCTVKWSDTVWQCPGLCCRSGWSIARLQRYFNPSRSSCTKVENEVSDAGEHNKSRMRANITRLVLIKRHSVQADQTADLVSIIIHIPQISCGILCGMYECGSVILPSTWCSRDRVIKSYVLSCDHSIYGPACTVRPCDLAMHSSATVWYGHQIQPRIVCK